MTDQPQYPKRVSTYHSSWYPFTFQDERPYVLNQPLCDALEQFCQQEYYVNNATLLLQKKDAVRMRLKGFLNLEIPKGYEHHPSDVFAEKVCFEKREPNTVAAKIARTLRKKLSSCTVTSMATERFLPVRNGSAGNISIELPNNYTVVDVIEMLSCVKDLIEDGTLKPLFNSMIYKRYRFSVHA